MKQQYSCNLLSYYYSHYIIQMRAVKLMEGCIACGWQSLFANQGLQPQCSFPPDCQPTSA